jgi:predicted Na+-dependent transporter
MTKNVGSIDKVVRIIVALVAAYFAYTKEFETAWLGYVLWAVAIIMLLTALTSRCPLFSIFGISTCKVKE